MQLPPIGSGPIGNIQGSAPQDPKQLANRIAQLTTDMAQNLQDDKRIKDDLDDIAAYITALKTANLPPDAAKTLNVLSNTFDEIRDKIGKISPYDLVDFAVVVGVFRGQLGE